MAFVEFVLSAILTAILLGAAGLIFYYLFLQPSEKPQKFVPPKAAVKFTPKGNSKRGNPLKGGKKAKYGGQKWGGRKKQKISYYQTASRGTKTKGCKNDINVGIVHGHQEDPLDMSWSPNGNVLATIDYVGHLRVFTDIAADEKKVKSVISVHPEIRGAAKAVCVVSDDLVIVGLIQKKLAFYRLAPTKKGVSFTKEKEVQIMLNFDVLQMISGNHVSLKEIIFMRDEGGEYVESINGLSGESYGKVKIKQGAINDMQLSPDAKLIAICTKQACNIFVVKPGKGDSTVHGCMAKTAGSHLVRKGSDLMKRETISAAFSEDGKRVAVAGIDGKIMVYSTDILWLKGETPQLLNVIEPDIKQSFGLLSIMKNNQLVLCSEYYLRVYNVETGKLLDEASNATKYVKSRIICLLWRPSVNMLMTLGKDKRITAWKPTTKNLE